MVGWNYALRCYDFDDERGLNFRGYLLSGRLGGGVRLGMNRRYAYVMGYKESSRLIMVLSRLGYRAVRVRV